MSDATRHHSSCPLDCPDACSLEVVVRDGRLLEVDGSERNPITGGYICGKVRGSLVEHLYGDDRLRQPLLRVGPRGGGQWREVSWDEALGRVVDELRTARDGFGGESILPFSYGGSNGMVSQDTTDARLFRRLGASRLARTVCAAPTTRAATALYGKMPGVAFDDYVHARAIVIWGANPAVSGIHLMPFLQEARRRGAWLAVVDPRRTAVARIADLHLALRPGTDLPVALSMIRWLHEHDRADTEFLAEHTHGAQELLGRAEPWDLERAANVAGVEADRTEELVRRWADAEPAVIRCGWGLERNRNGGSAAAAVLALPAVAGKFGVRGGGYTMSNSGAWSQSTEPAVGEAEPETRVVNMNRLGRALVEYDTPPVKVLFVYNCNPLATMPDQQRVRRGLLREDLFTVVFESVMTDTARLADVVLPATTFLERAGLSRGYGAYVMHGREAVVEPVGSSRSNAEVFAQLCRMCGVAAEGEPETPEELRRVILDAADGDGRAREALEAGGPAVPGFGANPVQFVDVMPRTEDGKVDLVPGELDREASARGGLYAFEPDPATGRFPLALISPASKRTISSTFGQLRRDAARLSIHPEDAAARGIEDGDTVRIHNDLGEVRCEAGLDPRVRPGVVSLPKGLWSHNTLDGNTANSLVPDTLTDLAGGACFNDARVEVERLEGSAGGSTAA